MNARVLVIARALFTHHPAVVVTLPPNEHHAIEQPLALAGGCSEPQEVHKLKVAEMRDGWY